MSRDDLLKRYNTRNVNIAIDRAIRDELGRGDVLDELKASNMWKQHDRTREFAAEKDKLVDEIRRRYGMPVRGAK